MDLLHMLIVGIIATITLDIWQQIFHLAFGVPITNWGMIARWMGHMPQGQFIQEDIGKASPIAYEAVFGWVIHYFVATSLAVIYLLLMLFVFDSQPSFASAMLYAVATICITWFFVEPALGLGVMASKAPSREGALALDFTTHLSYGVGLYLGVLVAEKISK